MATIAINIFFTLWVFQLAGLYKINQRGQKRVLIHKLIITYFFVSLALIALIFALKNSDGHSRIWFFSWFFSSACLLIMERLFFYRLIDKWGVAGKMTRNLAIVGTEEQATRLIKILGSHQDPRVRIVGIFDDRSSRAPASIHGHPIVGNLDSLIQHAPQKKIDDVLIALPGTAEQRTLEIMDKLEILPARISLCPDLIGFNFPNHSFSHYGGIQVLNVVGKPIDGWDAVMKTIEDQILGALFLLLGLPLMLLIAILVKLDSPGAVFFRQTRSGFNNQPIEVLKFRTLHANNQDNSAETLVTRDDPRVTRIGSFLRRSSLDELPQILNVLKGDMSIVGPRPHATSAKAAGQYYENVVARYAARHRVKPGITGWAQVNGWRGETDTEDKILKRVEHDLYYIEHWSILLDLRIILKTCVALFRSTNAY
jgi:Undecaprenyl-phosphate glucose phosphotransferase